MRKLRVAVIGAGMGGLATAAALDRADVEAHVFEQAPKFTRLGAGIQIGCNAMKVMREFGLEDYLRRESFYPRSWNNKDYDTRRGSVRHDLRRTGRMVPAFPYTFADTEFVQGDGRPK
jgi:salicylate hydroxylase/6-hydroxynicotinate 3-monooxygenase